MRIPGTFKQLWEQLATAPTPVTSISIPTEHGPLILTFAVPIKDEPEAPISPAARAQGKAVELRAPAKRQSDVAGAFSTPPPMREPLYPANEGS